MTSIAEALGVASNHHQAGNLAEAERIYRHILTLEPRHAEAHKNLGIALWEQGKLAEAIASYRLALALKPDYAAAHNNLGIALWNQGKRAEAIACYCPAMALKPHVLQPSH